MRKRFLRYLVVTIALALSSVFVTTPAFAAYQSVYGDSTLNFYKYLIVSEDARIPAMTFKFDITPGSAVAANSTTGAPAVLAGVGSPTVSDAVFSSGETASTTIADGDTLNLAEGQKYAKKTVNVDFSHVEFTQPGIYRYLITEVTDSAVIDNKAVDYDTQVDTAGVKGTRYLDVYVIDSGGTLSVAQYVLHKTATVSSVTKENDPVPDKSTGFVNEVASHQLTFGKKVTGNQGSKDKYFKFTITINNAQESNTYDVDVTTGAEALPTKTAATIYDNMQNPTTITTGTHGVVTEYFYLKDGQYITIKGLPEGFTYELSEVAEDYSQSATIAASEGTSAYSDPVSLTTAQGVTEDVRTGFTNDRSGLVPTGVIVTVAPFVIGILLFGAAIIYILNKRRREAYL